MNEQTEEWITAIRSAMRHQIATSSAEGGKAPRRKRATLSMKKFRIQRKWSVTDCETSK